MRRSSIEATASGSPACTRAVCSAWWRCSASESGGTELACASVCRKQAAYGSSGIEQTTSQGDEHELWIGQAVVVGELVSLLASMWALSHCVMSRYGRPEAPGNSGRAS